METFKRYLFFQACTLVFGIVGPIFLILFFTTQPDPSMKWAYWAGLFITAADVLIALALTQGSGKAADAKLAAAMAKRAQAQRDKN
jgi:hypothetical protein